MSNQKVEKVILPDTVTVIGENAFAGCSNLAEINMPRNLSSIGRSTFANCFALKELVFFDGISEVPANMCSACYELEKVSLPDSVKIIGESAFSGCRKLSEVRLSNQLESIGRNGFQGCALLSGINLPDTLKELGAQAFLTSGLNEIIIPENIEIIANGTFALCSSLEKAYIPRSVKQIAKDSFYGDSALTIYCGRDSVAHQFAVDNSIPYILNQETLPYTDVSEEAWYYDAVSYAYYNGLMTGLNETTFGPNESLARAQFAVILYRMEKEPPVEYKAVFPDVADDIWYTDAILWASDAGIVGGYTDSGLFGPGDSINREQMAVMMYRYANYLDYDTSAKADLSQYQDASNINDFAKEAMQWAVGEKIITGKYNETVLDPQGSATRAECATIIMRFLKTDKN